MTKYEELKKALESNRKHERHHTLAETRYWCNQYKLLAQQAIEALAQPAQEPVAMRYDYDGYGYKYIDSGSGSDWQTRIKDAEPLYATPPAAQPAQEPRLDQGPDYERGFVDGMLYQTQTSVDKAVNAIAQPAQEPVAEVVEDYFSRQVKGINNWHALPNGTKLYTTPPQRPWVGLTNEQRDYIVLGIDVFGLSVTEILLEAEAKLKEQNT